MNQQNNELININDIDYSEGRDSSVYTVFKENRLLGVFEFALPQVEEEL